MTEKDKNSLLLDLGLSTKTDAIRKSVTSIRLKCDGDEVFGLLSILILCFQEKLLKICYKYLYREPTQVVK